MNKHKVKAFTILEVTITMAIATILTGITYTTYNIISRSYLSFHIKNTEMATLEQLDHLLKKDFDRAGIIQKNNNGITITNISQTIQYEFNPDYITRTTNITDTFKVKTAAINTLFEGQPIDETNPAGEQNRLDELTLTLIYQNDTIPYHYHKHYSSVNLIQRNDHAIH